MSLTYESRQTTSRELRANLKLSGLSAAEVQNDLGLSVTQLDELLGMSLAAKPHDVWILRDYLEMAVRGRGLTPEPFTVLTPSVRNLAERWFPLRSRIRSH